MLDVRPAREEAVTRQLALDFSRGAASPESKAAFAKVNVVRDRQRAYAFIAAQGDHGATAKEIAAAWRVPLHHVSGRCSELKASNRIVVLERDGRRVRRDGSAVLVATEGVA